MKAISKLLYFGAGFIAGSFFGWYGIIAVVYLIKWIGGMF